MTILKTDQDWQRELLNRAVLIKNQAAFMAANLIRVEEAHAGTKDLPPCCSTYLKNFLETAVKNFSILSSWLDDLLYLEQPFQSSEILERAHAMAKETLSMAGHGPTTLEKISTGSYIYTHSHAMLFNDNEKPMFANLIKDVYSPVNFFFLTLDLLIKSSHYAKTGMILGNNTFSGQKW